MKDLILYNNEDDNLRFKFSKILGGHRLLVGLHDWKYWAKYCSKLGEYNKMRCMSNTQIDFNKVICRISKNWRFIRKVNNVDGALSAQIGHNLTLSDRIIV